LFLEPIAETTTLGLACLHFAPIVLILATLVAFALGVDLAILGASVGVVLIVAMLFLIAKFWVDGGMDG
jgi:uncharacterized membrane protein